MKKFLTTLSILILGLLHFIHAQSDVYTNLPVDNQGMYNPAAIGMNGKNFLTIDFNSKWHHLEFSPLRLNIGYERSLDKINSSLSVYYYYSQMGELLNTNTVGIAYNYRLNFAEDHSIRLGIQLNINLLTFDLSRLDPIQPDPSLDYTKQAGTKPDINLGFLYVWKRLQVGASYVNVFQPILIRTEEAGEEADGFRLPGLFIFLANYNIQLSNSFELIPAIYCYSPDGFDINLDYFDYSLNLSYKQIFNLGTVYRPGRISKWTIFAGAKIVKKVKIQFSYGIPEKDFNDMGPELEALISYSIN